jgi:hypothetical protein
MKGSELVDPKATTNTKTDGNEIVTANRQALQPQQNSQSRTGVFAAGNTCRPAALTGNSAHERYT